MATLKTAVLSMSFAIIGLAGCGGSPTGGTTAEAPSAAGPTLPAALFAASSPAGAVSLVDAKAAAKAGDRVIFEARVGGRRQAFVEGRAIFFVADPSLLSCDQLHGDSCKTPWDYCCETPDNLLRHMATVQVVDDAGSPLEVSLRDEHGLAPLKTVFVTGTVERIDESGAFVVDAETIHVSEG
jgi:hypothetical protein